MIHDSLRSLSELTLASDLSKLARREPFEPFAPWAKEMSRNLFARDVASELAGERPTEKSHSSGEPLARDGGEHGSAVSSIDQEKSQ